MELARLTLNLLNPQVRRDISDPYEMHSTLARAFAADETARPERFLWRLEPLRNEAPPTVIVQSENGGRWDTFAAACAGWSVRIEAKSWIPEKALRDGAAITFRLRCNPTVTKKGKRLGLWREDQQRAWVERQVVRAGMRDPAFSISESARVTGNRRKSGETPVVVCSILVEGRAQVAEVPLLAAAIRAGIGHAKMMGQGLLSVAPTA
jgi:CRISPR system Cascade subunit CasE